MWEFGFEVSRRRVRMSGDFAAARRIVVERGIVEQPLAIDRLIVATARPLKATLVTSDWRILAWRGDVERLDARGEEPLDRGGFGESAAGS